MIYVVSSGPTPNQPQQPMKNLTADAFLVLGQALKQSPSVPVRVRQMRDQQVISQKI
jgi:hypothetical protein